LETAVLEIVPPTACVFACHICTTSIAKPPSAWYRNGRQTINFVLAEVVERVMELKLSHEEGYVLAKTTGPIDETAEPLFREYLHPLVSQSGTRLIVEISASPRINSPGIAQLVKLVCDANARGSRIVFVSPAPFVASVLNVTHLDRFFKLAKNLSQAIETVQAN
jgi:anti-anti-sigma factor